MTATAKAKTPKNVAQVANTIGGDIDAMFSLREKKRALEAAAKDLEGQATLIEERLMESMTASGVEKATGKLASVSISSNTVANVEDWDAFGAYIVKNKLLHLLQRRVSDPAYRELLDAGKKVPGVQPFTKKRLNLRVVSS
jgi:hypothetical protein